MPTPPYSAEEVERWQLDAARWRWTREHYLALLRATRQKMILTPTTLDELVDIGMKGGIQTPEI